MSWTFRTLHFASFTLASLCIASGCADEEQSGNLNVTYVLGSGVACDALDIETVKVTLGNDSEVESAPCNPDSPIVMTSVKAGTQNIKVEAIDSEGFVVMDNVAPPTSDDKVEVLGGSSTDFEVQLSATPATIAFDWVLSIDDVPDSCNLVAPQIFDITAFENSGSATLLTHQFGCELPEPSFNPVPDPDRDINGADLDAVRVVVRDADGGMLDTLNYPFDPPGPGRQLNFRINCNDTSAGTECTVESPDIVPPSEDDTGGGTLDGTSG
ncbi:MAG: hypothetical protein IAG13_06425 [Deltaproteobacteria bacterium]|nr:hypothetical protein [Nannocystaceae bacterium]